MSWTPRLRLIQALIPLGLQAVAETLKDEVSMLTGEWSQRSRSFPGAVRWSHQRESVSRLDQKLPITYQRVRDRLQPGDPAAHLPAVAAATGRGCRGLFRKILHGLSCRRYEACAEAVPETFSLSPSTVSRRFIRASAKHLQVLCARKLDGYDVIALLLDGKTFAEGEIVIALGITVTREKVLFGFVRTAPNGSAQPCFGS